MFWALKKLFIITLFIVCAIVKVEVATVISPSFSDQIAKIAVTELPASFSPFASASLSTSRLMTDVNRSSRSQYHHLFFDPLIRWGKDKTIEFRLITKLELLENNNTRFHLKQNIVFHSGNVLTSNDVIWSLNEAVKNKQLHRKLQHIIEIKKVDDYRFDIQTQLTQAQLLDYLTHLFILDSEYYKKYHIDHNALQVAVNPPITRLPLSGTGPYQVSAFYPGVNLNVYANENYWQTPPALSSLNFVKVKSKESRLYALLAGDIDISEAVSNQNIDSVHLLDDKRVYQVRSTNALSLIINESSNAFFKDDSVRNAIHLSLNQAGMLRHILNGTGSIGNTFANATFAHENRTFESEPLNETNISQNSTLNALRLKEPVYDTKLAKLLLNTLTTPKGLLYWSYPMKMHIPKKLF
ncbi:ABC transporter substrate-binding protein [Psychromonas sp. KJ10-10]|uniref:ABC transporter substrate-binding protein n=1 Tax=Psychromonas sp. KJ10-10 TaxID=3391823 RepID=UPI0039B55B7E